MHLSFHILALLLAASTLFAQHPSLYFSPAGAESLRAVWQQRSHEFPQKEFKNLLSDTWRSRAAARPSDTTGWADYDRLKAARAKALAFRYLMERQAADGDSAFDVLWRTSAVDGYIYDAENYARWMTNGLALIDYCAAFDFLAGAGYFDHADRTDTKDRDRRWRAERRLEIVRYLHEKAATLFGRVSTPRSGSEAFAAQVTGNRDVLNEVKFHAQVGNHRIITASALGVAAYALKHDYPASETGPWLAYAKRDVEHFLLNRVRYRPESDPPIAVPSQNIDGAFPEGMEYLNYSGEGFVPFIMASGANGGEDYTQDHNFRNIMEWVWDVQSPDGSSPQINSTGYGVFPLNGIFAALLPDGPKHLAQLRDFESAHGAGGVSPVEAFCLLMGAHVAVRSPFQPIMVTASGGEVIVRDRPHQPTRYVMISTKHGHERSAAELHGYADAGSFIFSTQSHVLVRHPGYAGYSASRQLEGADAHNTIVPAVDGAVVFDTPDRSMALPPSADAHVVTVRSSESYSYVHIEMDVNGAKKVGIRDVVAENSSILSLPYEYLSANWMQSRVNMERFGNANRRFLLVNREYLIVADEISRMDNRMTYAVSTIHGNNGNRRGREHALDGTYMNSRGEALWSADTTEQLSVFTAVLGGRHESLSGFVQATHQSPDASDPWMPRSIYFHAALRTAAPFIGDTALIVSILHAEHPEAPTIGSISRLNSRTDSSSMIFAVDGRSGAYGRFDLVMARLQQTPIVITAKQLPFSVETDAAMLVMSFPEHMDDVTGVRIFADRASYIRYGPYLFTPQENVDGQLRFSMKKDR